MDLPGLIKLLRPKQWVKNGFVFMPLTFSEQFLNMEKLGLTCLAFFACCIASSCIYILNDLRDIELDKLHPIKSKTRPLALGLISASQAIVLLLPLSLVLTWFCVQQPALRLPIGLYLLINLSYTYYLKGEPVIDIFLIAMGFVIRIYAGAMVIHVPVSAWMAVTTLSLALFLSTMKRKQELVHFQATSRKSLEKYTLELIEKYAQMSALCAVMFYSLFVLTSKPELTLTLPITLFGVFRYWYVVDCLEQGESPTDALFQDGPLFLSVLIWLVTCIGILWPKN